MTTLVLVANAGDGTITSLRLDPEKGSLTTLSTSLVGEGCGTLAVDHVQGLVYAATKEPAIVTLRLDAESGELTPVARREVEAPLAYVFLAPGGATLLGASYDGGFAASWHVDQGEVGAEVSRTEYANCHCVVTDASGEHAYVVALGDDLVAQFGVDESGTLTPLDPPTVALPDGCGPRHLEIDGDVAYLVTEYSAEVFRFVVGEHGTLVRDESVRIDDPEAGLGHSVMGADPAEEHLRWGADVHRTGGVLLASERTASTLATVTLGEDGRLGEVVSTIDTETQPRAFGIAPDGRHVVVVGEKSPHAALYRLTADGTPELLDRTDVGETARWVSFV
ncbi:lactonase family protein [Mobilicoccus pelagius]|uniref:6-phosphogluconolactonase n=1 Tax=Mobilicoccus pelagius NBRC 104925 TaxID=1089455 RepID=H5UR54_9MICO|nr:beta-propeller fold lactonase family protein [Mobilicoccus pelagius]GAB48212.1 hypothetical protein MOPEL_067_00610 [Mobilicoccus pelagius NBRC 104925]